MIESTIGACGADCGSCAHYKNTCDGCKNLKGKPFWAVEHMPEKICPLFDCSVNKKKFENCGQCADLPCKMFTELKDPSSTDEEFKRSITDRVNRLKSLR